MVCSMMLSVASLSMHAQVYEDGLIDKSVAVVGNDMILLSDIEDEVRMMQASGYPVDANSRCQILENLVNS